MFSEAFVAQVPSGKCIAIIVLRWWCADLPLVRPNVFPGQARFHPHVMYFLADVCIPCGFCMGHCMSNVPVQPFEVGTHGSLDCSRKVMASVGGMEDLIAFLGERGKNSLAHLEPTIALSFVVGCSEHACCQNYLLVVIVFNSWSSEGEELFVVYHSGVLVSEYFLPVDSSSVHGTGLKFHR